jgi:hypothetical protein
MLSATPRSQLLRIAISSSQFLPQSESGADPADSRHSNEEGATSPADLRLKINVISDATDDRNFKRSLNQLSID